MIRDGYIPRDKPGRVSLVGAVQGYCRFLKEVAIKQTKTSADSEVRKERAREIRNRNDERERKLIPVEEAIAAQDYLVGVVTEALSGLPARVTRDITLRRTIEAELNAAKTEIAKGLGASADAVAAGKPLPYSSAAD